METSSAIPLSESSGDEAYEYEYYEYVDYYDGNGTAASTDDYGESYRFWTRGVALSAINGFGVIANLVVLATLSLQRPLTSTVILLITLAISDITVNVSLSALYSVDVFLEPNRYENADAMTVWYYKYYFLNTTWISPVGAILQLTNIWLLVAISVERYIAVCWPFHAQEMCSKERSVKVVGLIVALSVLYNIPRFFECQDSKFTIRRSDGTFVDLPKCERRPSMKNGSNYELYYSYWVTFFLQYYIPVLGLIVLNILVVRAIRRSCSFRALLRQRGGANVQTSMTLMCCGVVTLFVVCQTPGLIIHARFTLEAAAANKSAGNVTAVAAPPESESTHLWRRLLDVALLLYALNSAANFLVYCGLSQNFQNLFCQVAGPALPRCCRGADPAPDSGTGSDRNRRTEEIAMTMTRRRCHTDGEVRRMRQKVDAALAEQRSRKKPRRSGRGSRKNYVENGLQPPHPLPASTAIFPSSDTSTPSPIRAAIPSPISSASRNPPVTFHCPARPQPPLASSSLRPAFIAAAPEMLYLVADEVDETIVRLELIELKANSRPAPPSRLRRSDRRFDWW